MPAKNVRTPILPGNYYHIFNRGNNFENVFFCEEDYFYFLNLFELYVSHTCEIFAYALLPNHYHFLIRINEGATPQRVSPLCEFSEQFKNLIQDYTYRINSRESRSGNLFLKPFRRLKIPSENYFTRLIFYIHFNPYKHLVCHEFRTYKFSSYQSLLSNNSTILNRNDVLDWFGGKDDFVDFHNDMHEEGLIGKVLIE